MSIVLMYTGVQTLCDADSQVSIITPHSHNCILSLPYCLCLIYTLTPTDTLQYTVLLSVMEHTPKTVQYAKFIVVP